MDSVSDSENANQKPIPVTVAGPTEIVEETSTNYGKYKITVSHQVGDKPDPQTYIAMKANEVMSQIYNVSEKSLYHLHAKNLWLQCWFE